MIDRSYVDETGRRSGARLARRAALCVLLLIGAGAVVRATPTQASGNGVRILLPPAGGTHAVPAGVPATTLNLSSTHYVFVDEGGSPAAIDVFKINSRGMTYLTSLPTGGKGLTSGVIVGANTLATAKLDATHPDCLLHADYASNNLESFAFNPSTAQLTGPVSTITVPGAGDVHVGGDFVYTDLNNLSVAPIEGSCALGTPQSFPTGGQSMTLISSSHLAVTNTNKNSVDVYSIAHPTPTTTALTLLASNPTQLTSAIGAASAHALIGTTTKQIVFNGMAGGGKLESHILNLKTGVGTEAFGSPATGTCASGTEWIHAPSAYNFVTVTGACNVVNSFAYGGGGLAAQNSTPLDASSSGATAQVSVSSLLLVNAAFSRTISLCTLSTSAVSACQLGATAHGTSNTQGIAIF